MRRSAAVFGESGAGGAVTPSNLANFKEELQRAAPAALSYALRLCATKPWFNGSLETIRQTAQDLLNTAIVTTLDGSRTWDPSKVALTNHLCGTIKSLGSNLATSATMQTRGADIDSPSIDRSADATVSRPAAADAHYLSKEACEEIEADAYEAAGDDSVLAKVVEAITDGQFGVEDICGVTGLNSKEVYAAKKKLKLRRLKILKRRQE